MHLGCPIQEACREAVSALFSSYFGIRRNRKRTCARHPGTDAMCWERTFDSAKRSYPPHSDKQVGQKRKNSPLCGEPTDWPSPWRGEGVGGNIKQPGDDEPPSPNDRQ